MSRRYDGNAGVHEFVERVNSRIHALGGGRRKIGAEWVFTIRLLFCIDTRLGVGGVSSDVQSRRGTHASGSKLEDEKPELSEADMVVFLGDFKDRLRAEMKAGKVLQGMREGQIKCPPTYKFERHTVGLAGIYQTNAFFSCTRLSLLHILHSSILRRHRLCSRTSVAAACGACASAASRGVSATACSASSTACGTCASAASRGVSDCCGCCAKEEGDTMFKWRSSRYRAVRDGGIDWDAVWFEVEAGVQIFDCGLRGIVLSRICVAELTKQSNTDQNGSNKIG